MRVLVVGAGAVGQAFGYHLQKGGAELAFFVKEKYAAEARAGFTLYDLSRDREPLRFDGFDVLTTPDEVGARTWDLVLLCVASPALRSGTWLADIVGRSGDATIAGLQPGLGDAELVRQLAGPHRVVWGVIELIAYQAPLEGEEVPAPGVAFWIPWWLLFPFSGPDDRTRGVVAAFRAGGLRAKQVDDAVAFTAVGAPVLNLHIAALEASGWSLAKVRSDLELLRLTSAAVREAVAVTAREYEVSIPLWARLLRPWQVRILAAVAPRIVPLDLETYLRFHFTKVGEQTREQIGRWIHLAEAQGQPREALERLRTRLGR